MLYLGEILRLRLEKGGLAFCITSRNAVGQREMNASARLNPLSLMLAVEREIGGQCWCHTWTTEKTSSHCSRGKLGSSKHVSISSRIVLMELSNPAEISQGRLSCRHPDSESCHYLTCFHAVLLRVDTNFTGLWLPQWQEKKRGYARTFEYSIQCQKIKCIILGRHIQSSAEAHLVKYSLLLGAHS